MEIYVIVHLYLVICHKILKILTFFFFGTELQTYYLFFWLSSGEISGIVSVVKQAIRN